MVEGVWSGVIPSMLAAPGNVAVGMGHGKDDGVMLLSRGINLVLSIASGFKGQMPVFLNPFFIVDRLINL